MTLEPNECAEQLNGRWMSAAVGTAASLLLLAMLIFGDLMNTDVRPYATVRLKSILLWFCSVPCIVVASISARSLLVRQHEHQRWKWVEIVTVLLVRLVLILSVGVVGGAIILSVACKLTRACS